jgi:hypothetical protein
VSAGIGTAAFIGASTYSTVNPEGPGASILGGASTGAMIGMLFGPKGMIAGAILGGLMSWVGDISKSSDALKDVMEPIGDAFEAIGQTLGPTFQSLWDVLGSTVGIFQGLFPVFDSFKEETSSTNKVITGLKIILTPVVLAFQLIEQVANSLAWAFKGAELSIAKFRLFLSNLNPAKDPRKNILLRSRVDVLEEEFEKRGEAFGESFERHSKTNWNWFDMGDEEKRRAMGGPVLRNTPYLVGERGPELYVPRQDGTILSNMQLMGINKLNKDDRPNVSANFNVTFNVDSRFNRNNIEEIKEPIIAIINQAWEQATIGTASRGAIV